MKRPTPFKSSMRRQWTTSRRTLLRSGLAISPALLFGARVGKKVLTTARAVSTSQAATPSQAVPACVVTPQLTEGPYFVDEMLFRSDIRSDPTTGEVKDGAPLYLGFSISLVGGDNGCAPLVGAVVDVWQCDALGVYSDVRDPGFNTVGQKFLRGSQYTDENGYARFLAIYPGWYQGRTVHTHFKVRTHPDSATGYEFTSQLFYDDTLTDLVHAQPPYAAKGQRTLRNDGDDIFRQSGGQTLLDVQVTDDGQAYTATMAIGVDLSAPAPAGPGGGPPRPRPGR